MKKVSNKVLSRAFGGKMFGSKTECERWEGGCMPSSLLHILGKILWSLEPCSRLAVQLTSR